jgi:plasmid stabilization system protein ParE
MAELRWSKSAINDLEEILMYIAKDSEQNAKLFVAKMIDSIEYFRTLVVLFQN